VAISVAEDEICMMWDGNERFTFQLENFIKTWTSCIDKSSTILFEIKASEEDIDIPLSDMCLLDLRAGVATLKKPAAAPQEPTDLRTTFKTPLKECITCGGALTKNSIVEAKKYGFGLTQDVLHQNMQCSKRNCRANFGYNYKWCGSQKRNTLQVDQLVDKVIFVNSKTCFDLEFVQYHGMLQYRCFESFLCAAWVQESVYGLAHTEDWFRRALGAAIVLHAAMQELQDVNQHLFIQMGDASKHGNVLLETSMVDKYSDYLHDVIFPGESPSSVKEVAMDGHEKVKMRCTGATRRVGRPRKNERQMNYTNGWFMVVNPADSKILGVLPQRQPENNALKLQILKRIMPHYPNCNLLIHDRNCSFFKAAQEHKDLSMFKYYSIDVWHGNKHMRGCPCCPTQKQRLKRRLQGVNSSVSEQVFSWFRNYSRILNEMAPNTHYFLVLYFCRIHNDQVSKGRTGHLNPHVRDTRPRSESYACTRKRPAADL